MRYSSIVLRVALAGFLLACVLYGFAVFSVAVKTAEGLSHAASELLRINIPGLNQKSLNLQFGRTTGCNIALLERCAVLAVKEEILVHPEYLARMRQILERPCDFAIHPGMSVARQEELLRTAPNKAVLKTYFERGEPAWNKFGCDRTAKTRKDDDRELPGKFVLNIYRVRSQLSQVEVGDLARDGDLVLQLSLYR